MTNLNVIADRLKRGETVTFRPHGHSMTPYIRDGEEVTVRPYRPNDILKRGMIVLARVHGNMYLHFVRETNGDRVLIGSVHRTNGWTSREKVFGVKVQSSV